jgi:hypothetical protein
MELIIRFKLRAKLKSILFSIFLLSLTTVKSQDFCTSSFGSEWIAFSVKPLNEKNFFDYDSIVFERPTQISNELDYRYINLQCSDSIFNLVSVYTVAQYEGSVRVAGTSSIYEGIYQLDTIHNIISFKLNEPTNTYTFEIVSIGNKEINKTYQYHSNGDYRTKIILVKKDPHR